MKKCDLFRSWIVIFVSLGALFLLFLLTSGRFLVVNRPEQADIIVVLAGETEQRPEMGLKLLRQGLAARMLLDAPAQGKIYQWNQLQLAEKYVQALPETSAVSVCPVYGLSTKTETADVARCLKNDTLHNILLVTSNYHTRRALSTFRKELPQYEFTVAAAPAPEDFQVDWWRKRQWAKVNFDEWLRLMWWEAVDRWN